MSKREKGCGKCENKKENKKKQKKTKKKKPIKTTKNRK
jgi:hypothetical protein